MSGQLTQACITSVDGHSLNLFARNDEVLKRIDAIRPLSKFILIIQPYDFIKELKRAVKKLKNFSHSMRVSTD
ncbi:unnamed protein product [Anisakis simplex]|uniref:BLUF domain-containing protein n=1 Tax=Anisakis simplex TaxID=6269 RepID=A0A0M3JTC8_ANISI|nr:unnamed protein product [Anisakis simplex]